MNDQWYYAKNGVQAGPLSESDLKQMASSGQLAPVDMVWKTGMAIWVQAGSVQDLNLPSCPAHPPVSTSAPDYAGIFLGYVKKYKAWIGFAIIFLILCLLGWYSTKMIEQRNQETVKTVMNNLESSIYKKAYSIGLKGGSELSQSIYSTGRELFGPKDLDGFMEGVETYDKRPFARGSSEDKDWLRGYKDGIRTGLGKSFDPDKK